MVFQHLSNRPPFDDAALRDKFRLRLNEFPSVDIPFAKIGLRPGFPLTVLANPDAQGLCWTTSAGSSTKLRSKPRAPSTSPEPVGDSSDTDARVLPSAPSGGST